jgi:hypothetical protein
MAARDMEEFGPPEPAPAAPAEEDEFGPPEPAPGPASSPPRLAVAKAAGIGEDLSLDDVAASADVARQTGAGRDFAAKNLPALKAVAQRQELTDTLPTTPVLAEHMASGPAAAAGAKDDLGPLSTLEYFLTGKWERIPLANATSDDTLTFIDGERAAERMLVPPAWQVFLAKGVFALRTQELGILAGIKGGLNPDEAEQLRLSEEAAATPMVDAKGTARRAVGASVEAIPQVAMLAGGATKALLWLTTFGQMHNHLSEETNPDGTPKYSENEVRLLAGGGASATSALFGSLGKKFAKALVPEAVMNLSQRVAGAAVAKSLAANASLWTAALTRAGSAAKHWLTGALFMGGQSLVADTTDQFGDVAKGGTYNISKAWQATKQGLEGGLLLGPLSAVGPGVDFVADVGRWANAPRSSMQLGTMVEAAKASDLAKRSPEDFKALLSKMAGVDHESVYVSPEALKRLFGEDAPAAVQAMRKDDGAHFEESIQTNLPVELPTGEFLTLAAKGHADELLPDAKLEADGFTPREAAEWAARPEAERDWMEWANTEQPPPGSPKRTREPEPLIRKLDVSKLGEAELDSVKLEEDRSKARIAQIQAAYEGKPRPGSVPGEQPSALRPEDLPPINVHFDDTGKLAVEDGQHRLFVAREKGAPTINARIIGDINPITAERWDALLAHGEDSVTGKKFKEPVADVAQLNREMKEYTAALTAKKTIGEIKPGLYEEAARRAAARHVALTAAGDVAGATKSDNVRLMNEHMAQAARDAKAEAGKLRSSLEKAASDDGRAPFAQASQATGSSAYLDAYDALMQTMGMRPSDGRPRDFEGALERVEADGGEVGEDLAAVVDLVAQQKPFDKLTLAEAKQVRAGLRNLQTAAKQVNEVVLGEQKATVADVVERARAALANRPSAPLPGPSRASETTGEFVGKKLAAAHAEQLKPELILRELGLEDLFGGWVDARNKSEQLQKMLGEKIGAALEQMPKELQRGRFDAVEGPHAPGIADNKWVRQDLMMLFAWMGNPGNASRAAKGLGIPEENIWAACDQLTRAEMDFVQQALWDVNDKELWPLIAEHSAKKTGVAPPKIEAQAVVTKNGTYRGGYMHAAYNRDLSVRAAARSVPQDVADYYGDLKSSFPSPASSFTKKRVEGAFDVPDLNWSTYPAHLQQVAHFLAVDDFVSSMGRVLRNTEFRALVKDKLGSPKLEQLDEFLKTAARGKAEAPAAGAQVLSQIIGSGFRSRIATAAFGLNLPVVIGQLSHLPAMAAGLGIRPDHMAQGIGQALLPSTWAQAHENSKELPYRWNNYGEKTRTMLQNLGPGDAERPGLLTRAATSVLPRPAAEKVQGAVATGARWMDAASWSLFHGMDGFLSMALWRALEAKHLGAGADPVEARRLADTGLRDAMPPMNLAESSSMVRDRGILGSLMLVRRFPNTLYNVGALNAWQAQTGVWNAEPGWRKAKAFAGGTAAAAGAYLGMTLSAHLVGRYLMGHGKQEDESRGQWLARQALTAPFYPVPFGEEIATPFVEKIVNHKEISRASVEKSFRAAPSVALLESEIEKIGAAFNTHKRLDERLFAGAGAVMLATGVPTKPLQTVKYFHDLGTGRVRPRGPLALLSGIIYGKHPHQEGNPLSDLSRAFGE